MKSRILATSLCCFLSLAWAQGGTLTLEQCRQAARSTGELDRLYGMADEDRKAGLRLARSPYQTSVYGYGFVSYQSDTPNPDSMTDYSLDFHPLSKFQYHAGLMVSQPIYSGGKRKIKSDQENLDRDTEQLELDTRGMELDGVVDELYLAIILGRKRSETFHRHCNELNIQLEDARRAFSAGKAYRSDILAIEAKLSTVEASLKGNEAETAGSETMLATLTGLEIGPDTQLEMPQASLAGKEDPGLVRLDLEAKRLELSRKLSRASALPSIKAFGTAGYGKWGLNFFDPNPALYWIVGLKLTVPITSWRDVSAQGKLLDNAVRKLEIQRRDVERRKSIAIQRYDAQVDKYDSLAVASRRAVESCEALCDELKELSARGLKPSSEYLTALEQLSAARLDCELYDILKLQLLLERERYISKL